MTMTATSVPTASSTVSVRELKHALKLVKPFISRRSSISVLQHVKLDGFGLHATNMDAYASVPCDLYGLEACVVKPCDLLAALKGLTVRDSVSIRLEGSQLVVNGCALPTGNVEDWPEFPEIADESFVLDVPAGLVDALRDVATHASTCEDRPVLTGVRVVGAGKVVEVVATDSYVLAGMSLEASSEACDGMDALIPVDGGKYVRHMADVIRWQQDSRFARVDCVEGSTYAFRQIQGMFPAWRGLVPSTEYVADLAPIASGVLDTLDRCGKLARFAPVRLTFDPRGSFNVELRQTDGPEVDATWNHEWSDERFEIGVSPARLATAMRFVGSDARMGVVAPLRPMVLGSQDAAIAGSFRFSLVMPVRLAA